MSAAGQRGRRAETLAAWWLRLKGWRILARGYSIGRGRGAGEVDLIARRGRTLAFIEVKARNSIEAAAYAITAHQQDRIRRAALAFLAGRPELGDCAIRFDALLVVPRRLPSHICDAWRMET